MSETEQPVIPAATLVVFDDRAGPPPALLMVERAAGLTFAGGAMVFPGGRIEPGDAMIAESTGWQHEDGGARVAAIRETIEEAGLAIGIDPVPNAAQRDAVRYALHDGARFADVLAAHGLRLKLDALVPFARWCPRHRHTRMFDTRFFLAQLPHGSPEASADTTENVRLVWTSAAAMLAAADAGDSAIIFPTRRNLERLAQFASFADAAADAVSRPERTVTPWTENRDGEPWLVIRDDAGYPVTGEPMATAMRG